MSKVIQQFFTKLRHGSEELDPYSLNSLLSKIKRGFKKTLGFFNLRLWRSGTFGFGLNKFIRFSGTFAVAILLVITALAVCPVIIKTNDAEGTMGTAKASTSTITISSGESADLNVSTVSSTGTFTAGADADMATFTVTTDNYTGYTLNVSGSDDNGLLTNTEASASISSLAAATDAGTFANGSADTYNNKWGYQANILNTSTSEYTPLMSGNYLPAPTTTATAINTTACANGSTSCPNSVDTYGIRLGARLDYTKPTGTYTNTFILTAVANDVAYTITYADNTNDSTVTGSPINPAATTAGSVAGGTASNATLSSGTPTRTGYTFRAWCLGTATHTAGANSTCSGTEYSAGANFGIDQTIDNTDITLYALWNVTTYNLSITFAGTGVSSVAVRTASGASGGTLMGTVSTSGGSVSGLAYGVAYYLYPTFSSAELDSWENTGAYGTLSSTSDDNPTFTMGAGNGAVTITGKSSGTYMQNLAASECTTTPKTVYDSRDDQGYIIQRLADGKCWMMTNLDLNTTTANLTSANTNCYTSGSTDCIASGLSNATLDVNTFNAWKKMSGSQTYTAAELIAVSGTDTSSGGPGTPYGTLYNYCAASAGTICTDSNSSNASYDICPAGWRLPTGGSSGEFQTLYNNASYNTNAKMRKSYTEGGAAFALAGYFRNSTPANQGSGGGYWSSTRYNSTYMYYLLLTTSNVNPADNNSRSNGYSIRCVLKTMQDFSSADAAAMSVGDTRTLTDTRDGQAYTIRKLPDNNVWMVQNLRYVGDTGSTSNSMIMKADTSNINADKNLTIGNLTSGNSYDEARIHVATSDQVPSGASYTATDMGVWYNYAAASAMTITGSSNQSTQTYDICPKNWRLPTNSEQSGITSYKDAFSPVTGGRYSSGSVLSTGYGYWWSATSYDSTGRYRLSYDGSSLVTSGYNRNLGCYVRCIRST